MAKNVIIGCSEPFSLSDKDTGKKVKMIRLYVVRESMDTYGQKAEEVLLTGNAYNRIADFESNIEDLIGMDCSIDRNVKGKLEDFSLILPEVVKKEVNK